MENKKDSIVICPGAQVIGEVELGENVSIWHGAVVRGDTDSITIDDNSNVQDNCVVHCTKGFPVKIGKNVSVGHGAVVHGCTLGDYTLVGMGAVVMDAAVVEPNSLIAAGAVVTQGTVVPSGTIYAGNPARKLKDISPEQLRDIVQRISNDYAMYASWYTEEEDNTVEEK